MHTYLMHDKLNALIDIGRRLLDGDLFSNIYIDDLIEHSDCLLFWKNIDSKYMACNKKVASMGGLNKPQLIVGTYDYDMPWRKVDHAYRKNDQEVICYSTPKINIEESIHSAYDEELIILTSKFPIYSKNRTKKGVVGVASDITEQKIFERMLLEIQQNNQIHTTLPNDYICNQYVDVVSRLNKICQYLESNQGHYILTYNRTMIKLSKRQLQCIVEILHGKTSKQIGKTLMLSHRTIEDYINQIRKKFQCNSKNALIDIMLTSNGFIDSNK